MARRLPHSCDAHHEAGPMDHKRRKLLRNLGMCCSGSAAGGESGKEGAGRAPARKRAALKEQQYTPDNYPCAIPTWGVYTGAASCISYFAAGGGAISASRWSCLICKNSSSL